jgi:hypothetical protein
VARKVQYIGSIPLFIILADDNIHTRQIKGCGDQNYFLLGDFKNWDAPQYIESLPEETIDIKHIQLNINATKQ